jgi:hypothetical protein
MNIHLAWFETAEPRGPAIGTAETLAWTDFVSIVCDYRRVGPKDTTCFIPTRFTPEPNTTKGRPKSISDREILSVAVAEERSDFKVRRLGRNAIARTAIALDVETNKTTGEIPREPAAIAQHLAELGNAAVVYTSHSHTRERPRYRVVAPLSAEVDPVLPVCEEFATLLGLDGVLDRSKLGPAAVFYLPTCATEDALDLHEALAVDGHAIDAEWITAAATALQAERDAEQERIAAEAHAAAAERLQARIAAGFDPNDSLIEKIRSRLVLAQTLASHGYDRRGTKWRHPNSSSGLHGADIKAFGGIERLYSHNATDPLHKSNLPAWCTVAAVDAFDVVCILDFGGDRSQALKALADQFGITKASERKTLAKLLFRLIRDQAPQESIEAAAFGEGILLGLTRDEVCQVARWVVEQPITRTAAA